MGATRYSGPPADPSAHADLVKTDFLFPNIAARELGSALAAT